MRVLVTGAAGFIGRHLIERLAGSHEVFCIVRRPPPNPLNQVAYIQQDLSQPLDHARLPKRLDVIIHQAAAIDTDAFRDDAVPFMVNVVGTWRLLESARAINVTTFVHASTGGIYGCKPEPFVESDPANPMDLYSLTKAQAETAVQAASGAFHKIVLRYFFPYGVGTPNPIPSYVRKAVKGEAIKVLQDGRPALNPIHVSDAVEATLRAARLETDVVLNIAGTQQTSFAEISELAAEKAKRICRFEFVEEGDVIRYYRSNLVASIDRMQAVLDFTPRVSLRAGIYELAASFV